MGDKDRDEKPQVPPPPPRQPDESLKGYIERDNMGDHQDARCRDEHA